MTYTTKTASSFLAQVGVPEHKASDLFRNCVAKRLVRPCGKLRTGTKAYLFHRDQVLIAAIMSRVFDSTFSSPKACKIVSERMSTWDTEWRDEFLGAPKDRSPAEFCIKMFRESNWRSFNLNIFVLKDIDRGKTEFDIQVGSQQKIRPLLSVLPLLADPRSLHLRSKLVVPFDDIINSLPEAYQ